MNAADVQAVRAFNRFITRRVGALEESHLSQGRPLAEARLLFEIGPEGAELRDLRARLGLDSGYLSRLLRALERDGLITLSTAGPDGRVRRAVPTPAGDAARQTYDTLSDALAAGWLTPLSARQSERLLRAMADIQALSRVSEVEIRAEDPNDPAARRCLDAYYAELATRFDGGFDPGAAGYASGSADDRFLVAWLDNEAVGCGALVRIDATTAEVKRMWTAPSVRGLGIARRILTALEIEARAMGATTLRLDTNDALAEAQEFYRAEGFQPVARFNDNPYAHHWFAKRLAPADGAAPGLRGAGNM